MIWKALLQLFIHVSEQLFIQWYNAAKERQATDAQADVNGLSDTDVDERLRKWRRD